RFAICSRASALLVPGGNVNFSVLSNGFTSTTGSGGGDSATCTGGGGASTGTTTGGGGGKAARLSDSRRAAAEIGPASATEKRTRGGERSLRAREAGCALRAAGDGVAGCWPVAVSS